MIMATTTNPFAGKDIFAPNDTQAELHLCCQR